MIWKKGDIITQGRYNKVKNSYVGLPKSAALKLSLTSGDNYDLYTLDKTKDEVIDLLKSGHIVYFINDTESDYSYSIQYITSISDEVVKTSDGWYFDIRPNGQIYFLSQYGDVDV